jgi:hypothetical protein
MTLNQFQAADGFPVLTHWCWILGRPFLLDLFKLPMGPIAKDSSPVYAKNARFRQNQLL